MAEKLLAKLRVQKMEMADPITAPGDVDTANWDDLPLTLRDDEIKVVEEDPEEDELFSHENDAPEDTDVVGQGLRLTGSFVKASRAQMVDLMGGETTGAAGAEKYHHSASKLVLKKAIKVTCHDGSVIIAPSVSGYVNLNANLGKGGRVSFPFNFRCLKAAPNWDCDLIL